MRSIMQMESRQRGELARQGEAPYFNTPELVAREYFERGCLMAGMAGDVAMVTAGHIGRNANNFTWQWIRLYRDLAGAWLIDFNGGTVTP